MEASSVRRKLHEKSNFKDKNTIYKGDVTYIITKAAQKRKHEVRC